MERRHELLPDDLNRRQQYCHWICNRPPRFIRDVFICNEANFPMNGRVNSTNVIHYSSRDNPPQDSVYDIPNSRDKLVVWAGMLGNGTVVGPVFVNGNANAQQYIQIVNRTVVTSLLNNTRYNQNRNGSISHVWYSRDGAPGHTARV